MPTKPKEETIAIVNGRATPNRRLRQLIRLASGFRNVVEARTASSLAADPRTVLVTCWAEDAAEVADACERSMPNAQMLVWLAEPRLDVFELAARNPRIRCILAWPQAEPLPRIWELAYSLKRLVVRKPIALSPMTPLLYDGATSTWYPRSTQDLFATLDDLGEVLERLEIDRRTARRVVGVAHELLMNAMYDAPCDDGKPRFAHDRTQKISLSVSEAPSLVLSTDGLTLTLQISDPFGALRREHVYRSLVRGLKAESASRSEDVLDTSGGGAGLGLHRIIDGANAAAFDIVESRATNVTTTFDLGQSNRERRRAPKSLLYFQRAEPR